MSQAEKLAEEYIAMKQAIQRVRDLIQNECYHDEADNKIILVEDLIEALDGEQHDHT